MGASHVTVQSHRAELESIGQLDQCSNRQTSDGRSYPSQRKPVIVSNPTPKEEKQLQRPEIQALLEENGGEISHHETRRNISDYTRTLLALKYKEVIAAQAKERQVKGGELKGEYKEQACAEVSTTSSPPKRTCQVIAEKAGVGKDTVSKVEYIEQNASQETKQKLSATQLTKSGAT